jgi:hypothetical protein
MRLEGRQASRMPANGKQPVDVTRNQGAGYFVGVWACVVLRQPLRAYEEELPRSVPAQSTGAMPALAPAVELEA